MNNTAVYPNMLSVKKAADKFGISEYSNVYLPQTGQI